MSKLVDWILWLLAALLLPTLLITVPFGLVFRALRDGLLVGWEWPDRNLGPDQDKRDQAFENALLKESSP